MGLCLAQFRCAQQQSHRTEACSFYLVVFALFPRCATFYHCFTAAFLQRALSPTWSVRPHTRAAHLPDIWGRKRDVADVLILLLILSWFVLTFNFFAGILLELGPGAVSLGWCRDLAKRQRCLVWTLTSLPFHRWRWCCATLIVIVEWVLFGMKYVSSWKKEFIKPGYIQYIELTSTGTGAARHLGS